MITIISCKDVKQKNVLFSLSFAYIRANRCDRQSPTKEPTLSMFVETSAREIATENRHFVSFLLHWIHCSNVEKKEADRELDAEKIVSV